MLKVSISNAEGTVIAEGTCSDSGYFPPALASIYNAGLKLVPARSLESFGSTMGSAEYPVGTRRVRFGYRLPPQRGRTLVLDDEVIVHVERA
jgi:hypothetical protein